MAPLARLEHYYENVSLKIYFFNFFPTIYYRTSSLICWPSTSFTFWAPWRCSVCTLFQEDLLTSCLQLSATSLTSRCCLSQGLTIWASHHLGDRARQGYKCLAPGSLMLLAETWVSLATGSASTSAPVLLLHASFHRY